MSDSVRVIEPETEYMPFSEPWVGRAPKQIYAVKVRGKGVDGKTSTYIFLHGSKGNFDRQVEQLPKGLIRDDDVVTTYVGTVEWTQTGTLTPNVKVVPEPKPAKRRNVA